MQLAGDAGQGMSGQDIYRNFTEGEGGQGLAQAAAIVQELTAEFADEDQAIRQLVSTMESVWEGDASGAAARGAGPLAVEHGLAAPDTNVAQDLANRQIGSFVDGRNGVVPVPEYPGTPDPWTLLSPEDVTTYEKLRQYHEANNRNVDVMNAYTGASMYNTDGMPTSQGSLDPDGSAIVVGSPREPGAPPPPRRSSEPDPSDGVVSGEPGPEAGPSTSDSPVRTDSPDATGPAPGGGSPSQGTTPGGYIVPPAPPGPVPPPGHGPGTGAVGPVPGAGVGLVPVGGPGPGSPGGGPGSGAGSGGRDGAPAGRGPGSPRGGAGVAPGPGALAAEEAAARRAGGAALAPGRGGVTGGVPFGAGMGRPAGGGDTERERPEWLINPEDPELTFGVDTLTAPPVIGEEPDDGAAESH